MSITLYNTMTRQLQPLVPQKKGQVSLYTCGPTVYDYPQIGNWATYVRWDTLVRMLRASNLKVNWVMNITDVGHLVSDADEGEDKLEKGARREGKTAWQVAEFYTQEFMDGMQKLHIQMPTHVAKATDHIAEQIALIKKLEKKNFTYSIDDGVYFNTAKLSDYGKLARLDVEGLRGGARVELNQQKQNVTDFALWKFSPKDEQRDMEWDSPWGKGFPGWHIECSAMAMRYLGEMLDIHAGGIDFIPVHHTNEIAQSEAVTGKPFANLWLHGNFLTVDGIKLSKSLGNSYSLQDIVAHGFDALDLRLLVLQSHYRTQADFTWESLHAARERRQSLQAMADMRFQLQKDGGIESRELHQAQATILHNLQHDLNTPKALAVLAQVEQSITTRGIAQANQTTFQEFLSFIDSVLGLQLLASQDISPAQKTLLAQRQAARQAKNWQAADSLRARLQEQHLLVRDTPHGQIWQRSA